MENLAGEGLTVMNGVFSGVPEFLDILGLTEEPFGMCYGDVAPAEGVSPKPAVLPTVEDEAAGRFDWMALRETFGCVLGVLWRARKKRTVAFFDRERFGCLGGAFYLGFLKPQLELVSYYVSTGIPGRMEGERYLSSQRVTKHFFETVDPRPAPARFCLFKPISMFQGDQEPELITFFVRPESMAGLHQLATFVTDDFEVVRSPFGAGCTTIVTWPLRYTAQGELKAVIGCWDPSDRKFLKADEITFTVPLELFRLMLGRWNQSFLTTRTWQTIRQRILRSRRAWGEK